MFTEHKVFDDGIWLSRHELQRCYNERMEYLKTVTNFPTLSSRTIGQLYFLEELIAKCDKN